MYHTQQKISIMEINI